jgi:putative peptide zinc metalloprotease protein
VVITDPYTGNHFRASQEAWDFLQRLNKNQEIEEIWKQCLKEGTSNTPGQVEVVSLVSQMSGYGMLLSDYPSDLDYLVRTQKEKKQKQILSTIFNILFLPVPLWDPNEFLKRCGFIASTIFTQIGLVCWLLVVLSGVLCVTSNNHELLVSFEGMLAFDNLIWLYFGWIVLKFFHEIGHGLTCRFFGGEVHTMGLMFLVFVPVPYVDVSSSWQFRERWKRVLVGGSGMMTELFFAGIFAVVWAYTGDGLVHSLAYNFMIIGSVSTLLFNINPLLRLDGYYILSDLLDVPNLHTRSFKCLKQQFLKITLNIKGTEPSSYSGFEKLVLPFYCVASNVYRILVLTAILFYVAEQFFGIGLLFASITGVIWICKPVLSLVRFLLLSPETSKKRKRSVGVACLSIVLPLGLLFHLPFSHIYRCHGVLKSMNAKDLIIKASGVVTKVYFKSGQRVKKGQLLFTQCDDELGFKIDKLLAQEKEVLAKIEMASHKGVQYKESLSSYLLSLKQQRAYLEEQQEFLEFKSPRDGILWLEKTELTGKYFDRGMSLGKVVDENSYAFYAMVSQDDMAPILEERVKSISIRLIGQSQIALKASIKLVTPSETFSLPSKGLGIKAGGEILTNNSDPSGTQLSEPHYLVVARIEPSKNKTFFSENLKGILRMECEPKPLGYQLLIRLRQIFQKRIKI